MALNSKENNGSLLSRPVDSHSLSRNFTNLTSNALCKTVGDISNMIDSHLLTVVPRATPESAPAPASILRDENFYAMLGLAREPQGSRRNFGSPGEVSTRDPTGCALDELELKRPDEFEDFLLKKKKKYDNDIFEMNMEEAQLNVDIDNLQRDLSWTSAQSILMKKILGNLEIDERNLGSHIEKLVKDRQSELSRVDLEYAEVLMTYEKKLKLEQEAFQTRAKNFQEATTNYCY